MEESKQREDDEYVIAFSDEEEENTFWFLGLGKHWYQVEN